MPLIAANLSSAFANERPLLSPTLYIPTVMKSATQQARDIAQAHLTTLNKALEKSAPSFTNGMLSLIYSNACVTVHSAEHENISTARTFADSMTLLSEKCILGARFDGIHFFHVFYTPGKIQVTVCGSLRLFGHSFATQYYRVVILEGMIGAWSFTSDDIFLI